MLRFLLPRALCAAVFPCILCAPALADPSPSPSPSPSALPQIAHVVTSDRGSESATSTARTTYVVTADQIAQMGARTVSDALVDVPGVNVLQYGAFGALTSLGIRGSSSSQVLVLEDGLPIAGVQTGDINLEELPVAGISRIEVVEGGGSTLYGSGSIGGVINIITANQTTSQATLSTGSFGEQTYAFTTPYISFQRTYATNDYSLPDGATRQNAYAGLTGFQANYEHKIGAIDARISGDISNLINGDPGSIGYLSSTQQSNAVNRNIRLNLSDSHPRSTTSLTLGDSSQDDSDTCDTPVDENCPNSPYPPKTGPDLPPYAELLYDQHWMASLRNETGDNRSRIVYGIDALRGDARIDPGTGGGAPSVYAYAQTAAYVQSQWFTQRGDEVYAGLRGERDGGLGGAYSPSLGGILAMSQSLQLKANASTAFNAPSILDLYYPGYSNPNLVPERTREGDVTLVAPQIAGGVSLGWFTTTGKNLIALNSQYIPENIGRASIAGLVATAKTRPVHGYHVEFSATDLYKALDRDTGERIDGRGPVWDQTVSFVYEAPPTSRFDGFTISATTAGPQFTDTIDYSAPTYDQTVGYTLINASIGLRILPHTILAVRGYNLGNERYAEEPGYPLPGRAISVELRSKQ